MTTTLTARPKSNATDPKFKYLQKRVNDAIMLSIEKAAGHLLNPQSYPLPTGKSVERALYEVIMTLPKRKRDDFTDKLKAHVNAGDSERKQKYADLHVVNLSSNRSVVDQVRDIPIDAKMKFTEQETKITLAKKVTKPKVTGKLIGKKPVPQQASVDATTLQLIVDSVTCVKTNDIRKDEINLGAFAVDNFGTGSDKAPFFVGEFKKTESLGLGGNSNLFTFSIDGGSTGIVFPATFVGGLFIVESDLIKNVELGNKLVAFFAVTGIAIGVLSIGLLFIAGIGPALMLTGWIIGGAMQLLSHYFFTTAVDDFSFAATDTLVLDAPPAVGDTFSRTLTMDIFSSLSGNTKGSYTANIRWVAS